MRNLDFLSEYPRAYIFQKDVNKTNFGGVLFIIYAIIMIIISLSYILDYYLNDKYEIEYSSIRNQTLTEDLDAINANPDLNPTMEFLLTVEPYSNYFKIMTYKNNKMVVNNLTYNGKETGFIYINSTVADFQAFLVFSCGNDSNCTLNEEKEGFTKDSKFHFEFTSPFPKIDNQNSSKPIVYDNLIYNTRYLNSNFKSFIYNIFYWKVIKYKEKKGISRLFDKLFDLKSEYFTGYYAYDRVFQEDSYVRTNKGSYYKLLIRIELINDHSVYDEYQRSKKTELDVLSTISALFTPIRLVFLFIYGFYSNNFNNYKMIENILNQKFKNKKLIELKDFSEKKDSPIKDLNDNEKQEILIKTDLIEKTDDIEENNEKEDDNDSEFRLNKKERILPKYSFMQFFLNNIYCKSWKSCAKYERQQEILEICNTINKKYLSIDSILYNQIMIENLLRDYNWNNSLLNNIKNNELILKLKNLIE